MNYGIYNVIKYRPNYSGYLISRTVKETSDASEARKIYREAIGKRVREAKLTPLSQIGADGMYGVELRLGGTVLERWGTVA